MSDCTFCHSSGSCCNAGSRGGGSWLYRKRDRADISADNLPPPPSGVRVQIDDGSFGRDISDIHLYLCRNDKISDCCCTLDMKNGMISP